MNRLIVSSFFLLAAAVLAQAPGMYAGTWASASSGNSGKLNLTFSDAALTAATFTYRGQEITSKPGSNKKDGSQVDFVFNYDIDGNALRSHMQGTVGEANIKGKYQSTTADGSPVDEGTWEVTKQ